ncbi:MAG: hypothetical protein MZV70_12715 [Desulfobacterales bacterium]|nr:hypothetical protein [Desulfobacterales bacterium]
MASAEHPIEEPFHAFCPYVLNLKKGAQRASRVLQMRLFRLDGVLLEAHSFRSEESSDREDSD